MAGVQGGANGFPGHDLGSGAKGNLTLVENEGVRENFGHALELVVGRNDEVTARGEVDQRVRKVAPALDVEAVERFVEQKDMGLLGEGPGNEGALLLAAGELVNLPVGNVAQLHRGNRFLGFFTVELTETAKVPEVGEAPHRHDIADPDRKMTLVLIDLGKVGDFAAGFRNGTFPPAEGAGLGCQESGQEPDEGAFACTIGTQKGEALAAMDRKGDVAKGFLASIRETDVGKRELVVGVIHFISSQVKVISLVTSENPQRVSLRPGRLVGFKGSSVMRAAVSGVSGGQTTFTVRTTSGPTG